MKLLIDSISIGSKKNKLVSLAMLWGLFTAFLVLASCNIGTVAMQADVSAVSPDASRALIPAYTKGVDISEAYYAASKGVSFKDTNGVAKAPLQIFKDHGYTWARVRLMIDGSSDYALFQDMNYVKAAALDIKAKGMKFLLDLHYSHWWADPGNQWTPSRWSSYTTVSALASAVRSYTKDVMAQLVAQGTPPALVQIGNEVNNGMLWELGRLAKLSNFATLEAAGAYGIQDGKGSATMPPIMVHVAKDMSASAAVTWYKNFIAAGGWVDAIGLSYYPMWHGSQTDLSNTIKALRSAYSWAPVWVVETAYYWSTNQAGYSGSQVPYAQTPAGQASFLAATKTTVVNAGGSGIFYWGACWAQSSKWLNAPGWTNDDASRRSLFNDSAVAQVGIGSL